MYYTEFDLIPKESYQVIYADPPWPYKDKMAGHSLGAAFQYQLQPMQWIKDLQVQSIAARDSTLFMWVPSPLLVDGLEVMKAWGFKFKTVAFVWSKVTKHGLDVANMGRWTMGNVEIVLLGTRGKPQREVKNVRQLVRAERTVHSHKPDVVRERIVTLMGDVPRIELFCRGQVEGWDAFGNQPDWTEYGDNNRGEGQATS